MKAVFGLLLAMATLSARAAAHTHARLVLAAETARPGDTVMAGVHLHMDAGWHTYWRNAGQSGIPTSNKWYLPKGVTVGEIQWPVPEKYHHLHLRKRCRFDGAAQARARSAARPAGNQRQKRLARVRQNLRARED